MIGVTSNMAFPGDNPCATEEDVLRFKSVTGTSKAAVWVFKNC